MEGTASLGERAERARTRIYGELLPGDVRMAPCDEGRFWERSEEELRRHFPPEVYFHLDAPTEAPPAAERIVDHFLLLHGERLVGATAGRQLLDEPATYATQYTCIHPDFRRRGIYAELQRRVIAYSAELGFARVESRHAPGNNAVLIAKLRAGFRIVMLDLDPAHGPTLVLRYFHEPVELAAYEYRCGLATVTPELARTGYGAWDELARQLRASS